MRSLQSGHTTSTKFTLDSMKSGSKYGSVFLMGDERVVGIVHVVNSRITSNDMTELRLVSIPTFPLIPPPQIGNNRVFQMRLLDNDNVNRFLGLSIDGPQILSIWRYCSRGALAEVILGNNSLTMDGYFIYSLIRDVCEGLRFLHSSPIGWHGSLRSTNCLIDDRWQVKLSEYGMKFFREVEKREAKGIIRY